MLTVAEAIDVILSEVQHPAPAAVPLPDALALILAEDIDSDVDSPPFDKAPARFIVCIAGTVRTCLVPKMK